MSSPRMRPTFEIACGASGAAVVEQMQRRLREPDAPVAGVVVPKAADLWMPDAVVHFWSPTLTLWIYDDEEGGSQLKGRFGPRENVWTLFMATYGLLVLAGIAALMWGTSEWMLSRPPWTLLGAPAAAVVFGFVYGAAFIGQGLGGEQMYTLRRFVEEVAEGAEALPPASDPAP